MNSASTTGFGPTRVAAIPATARTARAVMLVAPSSAVVERMFSVFKRLFGDQQSAALGDYECVATLAEALEVKIADGNEAIQELVHFHDWL